MPGSGIEYPTLAFRPDPGPRFRLLVGITGHGIANHKNSAILRIVSVMKVSFVPSLDVLHPGNGRVILGNDPRAKDRPLVALEAPAHELVEFGNV